MSLLLAYSWLSLALDMVQMALNIWKNRKPTQLIILDKFYFGNFSKKSIHGYVLALCLLLAFFGLGRYLDGPGNPEKPETNPNNYP